MDHLLFEDARVFKIRGRGTVITGSLGKSSNATLSKGDVIECRSGENVLTRLPALAVEALMVSPPPPPGQTPVGILVSSDLDTAGLDGCEVWQVENCDDTD